MIRNYIGGWTENFREWLAWKIFPEFGMYTEVFKRVGEIEENERCIQALEEADSACSGWAVDTIKIKYTSLQEILNKLKEDGYDEPPF